MKNALQSQADLNSDLFNSNRPQLDPVLVIDSVNSNLVTYYFEVNNLGKTTGADITFYEDRADYRGGLFNNGHNSWHLAPGAKMTINTVMPMTLQSDRDFSTDLVLKYRLSTGRLETNFISIFRYAVPTTYLHAGRFFYIWSEEEALDLSKTNELNIQKQLAMPRGTIFISMIAQKLAVIDSENRRLIYDPNNKSVEFDNRNFDGTVVRLTRNTLETENGDHFILFSWGANFSMLSADNITNTVTWKPKLQTLK